MYFKRIYVLAPTDTGSRSQEKCTYRLYLNLKPVYLKKMVKDTNSQKLLHDNLKECQKF